MMRLYPNIIGHRGAGRLAPENTLAAMRVAARYGIEMVEYDVALSRDGIPILLHDQNIARTSTGSGNADDMTLAELARFDFGSWHSSEYAGEPIATLYSIAAFTRQNNIRSNIEIKPQPGREALTGKVVASTAALLWQNAPSPVLSSFSEIALEAAMASAPELPRALLLEGPLNPDWQERADTLGCVALHLQQEHIDRATIKVVRDKGYRIAAWTVNDVARARELLRWGCDGLFTDAIHALPPALRLL
ncbi:glycerophosphodiester phosphodiesterase [Pusillimonas sp.]|uniref:glycerophosphodiester phosphodiesterase n=2 Tax=unclassified Pusillimonas TaxID=2640016 RepID=UPI0039C9183B